MFCSYRNQYSNWVTSIENRAFIYYKSLTEMYIPNRVTSIGSSVFSYCSALTDIYCEVSSIPKGWDNGQFSFDCQPEVFWDVSQSEYDAIRNNASVPYDISQPTISVDSGNVTINCDKTFAHIYYTTDGTEPDNAGKLYTEPFAVGAGRAVKAVSYVGNDIYITVAEYVVE